MFFTFVLVSAAVAVPLYSRGFIVQVNRASPRYECYDFFDGELVFCKVPDMAIMTDPDVHVIDYWWNMYMTTQTCQTDAQWHLSKLNGQRANGKYAYADVQPSTSVYIIDTWVDVNHPEFQGRAWRGPAFEQGSGQSHGTHVAGLVGSKTYGVNKNANLISVQVLNGEGQGQWSSILAGLEWVSRRSRYNSIINMSIGGGKSSAIDAAVNAMARHGWRIVVAAGNAYVDACTQSPSGAAGAVTVGAFDIIDRFATFSNFGSCVDLHAPGVDVLSAYPGNRAAWSSGTSMSSPIVAGVWSLNPMLNQSDFIKMYTRRGGLQKLPVNTADLVAYSRNSACGVEFSVQPQ